MTPAEERANRFDIALAKLRVGVDPLSWTLFKRGCADCCYICGPYFAV